MYLVLFIASGIALAFLVIHKHMEVAYGKRLIVKTLAHKADGWFHICFQKIAYIFSFVTISNAVWIMNHGAVFLARGVLFLIALVHKNTTHAVEKLSHTKETLNQNGTRSEYLKRIGETKNTGEEGKEKKEIR